MPRLGGYYIFFIICAATLTTRAVLDSSFRNSTLLYLLIPFAISIALHLAIPITEGQSPVQRYGRHMRAATIVMLANSALLFEGFLCVLFFMPIYYLVVSFGFLFSWLADRHGGGGHHLLTGYPCTVEGELLIAAWEFGAGRYPHWGATLFCAPLILAGLLFMPGRIGDAWRRGRRSRSLYRHADLERLADLPLAAARFAGRARGSVLDQ